MEPIFESVTVTISKREYTELIEKAFAYDVYSKVVTATINRGGYVSDMESGLFYKEEPKEEEGLKEFFSAEEWEKVVELAEEVKE